MRRRESVCVTCQLGVKRGCQPARRRRLPRLARSQSKHRALSSTPPSLCCCPTLRVTESQSSHSCSFWWRPLKASEHGIGGDSLLATAVVAILLFLDTAPDKHGFSVHCCVGFCFALGRMLLWYVLGEDQGQSLLSVMEVSFPCSLTNSTMFLAV
jgi:hypothetical protein